MYGHVIMVLVCLQFLGIFNFHQRMCLDRDIIITYVINVSGIGNDGKRLYISASVSFVVN